uniref:Uncharacterized protein n=1 Tax=Physcomitrium patens TaxID=3218 RepID=A0A2K1J4H7_PHYPA|nr:hypothetical protein PHYPA_022261 [Physcomitrium patens]
MYLFVRTRVLSLKSSCRFRNGNIAGLNNCSGSAQSTFQPFRRDATSSELVV